jgi:two-component system, NarL family, response regulator NreC
VLLGIREREAILFKPLTAAGCEMIEIVLADDHKVVLKGLKALLGSEADFRVTGEAEDGLETLNLVERLKPDILVLDMMMPGMNGLEVTSTLKKRGSKTDIVILSMQNCDAYISQAFRSGAKAYVLKEAPPEELITAIREVMAGRSYLCSALEKDVLNQQPARKSETENGPYLKLTPRENEILNLTVKGMSSKDIAVKLGLSTRTVDTHRTNLMQKLNVHSQALLVRLVVQTGRLSAEPNLLIS